MTTIKEFEQQKQQIWKQVINLINGDHDDDYDTQIRVIREQINKLLPPRPTCSTCKYKEIVYGTNSCNQKIKSYYLCTKVKHLKNSDKYGEWHNDVEIPLRGWGCNKHSDYEEKNE